MVYRRSSVGGEQSYVYHSLRVIEVLRALRGSSQLRGLARGRTCSSPNKLAAAGEQCQPEDQGFARIGHVRHASRLAVSKGIQKMPQTAPRS